MRGWSLGVWSMRLYYLWFFGAAGIYFPYVSLYYQAIHLDGAQIGLLFSLPPLASVLLPPLWGVLSDRRGWRKQILTLSLLAGAILAPIVPLFGSFLAILLAMVLLAVGLSPVLPLADATTLEWLREHGGTFGSVRIFGSIGFLISSLAGGLFFTGPHILWLFPLYGAALFCACAVTLGMPSQGNREHLPRGEGVRFLLRDRRVTLFLALVILGSTSFAAYNTFFSLYLQGLGAGTGVIGLATGIATLSELPGMLLAGYAVGRIGTKPILLLGMASCVVRWLGYSLIGDYHIALLLQPLHGLCFGASYVAGVTFVDTLVPSRLRSTGQTLFNVAFFGAGAVIGSNLFGVLYDHIHGAGIFAVATLIAIPALLGLAIFVPNVRGDQDRE